MAESLHAGHRQRMRERFWKNGLTGFQEHEILEFLLFYAIPRVNTNELAHRLLQRFGSIQAILVAEPSALRDVTGMTENAAALLKLIPAVYGTCVEQSTARMRLDSFSAVCGYFQKLYQYENREILRLACLDDMLRLKSCHILSEGDSSAAAVSLRQIAECAIMEGANTVILAHNHPSGAALASPEDISATRRLFGVLRPLSIRLVDHVIVGNDGAISLREQGTFACLEEE